MRTSKILIGVFIGLATGAVAGLLMAPDHENQAKGKKLSSKGRSMAADLKSKFNAFLDDYMRHAGPAKDV